MFHLLLRLFPHLHFNFLPKSEEVQKVDERLKKLYKKVKTIKASPFAEHGLGLLKKPFINDFWNEEVIKVFRELKKEHDPHNIFFPEGYLNW